MKPITNRHFFFTVVFLFLSTGVFSQEVDVNRDWILNLEDDGSGYGAGIVTDDEGNVFVIGSFSGTCFFNEDFVESAGQSDVLVAKITEEGEILWVKNAGGASGDYGVSVDIMQNTSLYISGVFQDTAFFGEDTLIARGDRDLFLSKMDMDGNFLWSKSFGGDNLDVNIEIVVDDQYVYATGGFRGTGYFDDETLISHGNEDIFVAKFDNEGNIIWLEQSGSDEYEYGNAIEKDQSGNIYVAAYFRDTCYFQTDTFISRGNADLSLAKYDPDGNMLWVRQAGSQSFDIGNGLSVDNDNNLHFTGLFNETLYVQGDSLVSEGDQDIFFLSFDSDGNLIARHSAGGNAEYENGLAVVNDDYNNAFYAGYHTDTSLFNDEMIVSNGEEDAFICGYSPGGELLWLENAGGRGYDEIGGLTVHNNILYAIGTFEDTLFIGNDTLISGRTYDTFVAKYTLGPSVIDATETAVTSDLIIFPIPAGNYIAIELNRESSGYEYFEILDIQGRTLRQEPFHNSMQIDISGLPKGTYVVRVVGDEHPLISRFMKK